MFYNILKTNCNKFPPNRYLPVHIADGDVNAAGYQDGFEYSAHVFVIHNKQEIRSYPNFSPGYVLWVFLNFGFS